MTLTPLLPNAALRRPGRRERRRIQTREQIYRAAMNLFTRRGFHATTVEEITEAADVGKGTFFNYFPTKEHVLAMLAELQRGKVRRAVEQARQSGDPVEAILHRLVHALAEEPGRSPALFRSLLAAILSSRPVRDAFTENLLGARALVRELLVIGQRRGELRRDFSPDELAYFLQRAAFGTLMLWAIQEDTDLSRSLEKTFHAFWSGAAAARPHRRSKG
jgi:AcrR family transcriptional regulator